MDWITVALISSIIDFTEGLGPCAIELKFKDESLNKTVDWIYHIVMIYHSDSRAGVPRRGDLAGQMRRLAIIAELV